MKKRNLAYNISPALILLTPLFASAAGLVPCTNDCNLCYLLIGISNIFQWLMGALLGAAFLLI